ncbi:MAG: AAA family ATPase, partial [Alistipes sp.]|nr:AAA family ATPase [Alistipes sp.]
NGKFKFIEIQDNRLLNYDKTKLRNFIDEFSNDIQSKKNNLSVSQIEKLSKSIKPQDKSQIIFENSQYLNLDLLGNIYTRVWELCTTSITSQSIDRLKQNPQISQWVFNGLKYIHTTESTHCEFCGQLLPDARISELNKHFSDEFSKLQEAISKGIEWIESNYQVLNFPHSSLLYEEYVPEYQEYLMQFTEIIDLLNNSLTTWKNCLKDKQQNPFETATEQLINIPEKTILNYREIYKAILDCIDKHNNKFQNLEEEIKIAKQKLELHYVAEEVNQYDYFRKKEQVENYILSQREKSYEIDALNITITSLRSSLANEHLGEKEFNAMLHKFLGRNDLSIMHREEGGYNIKRYQNETASNISLSEGEKTAIGLVYFITKLKENGNKIEETIIVLDDPISSFDSNHLFHANYYIKQECENAKQLFIFTHNFRFFALLKDWVCTKRKKNEANKNVDLFHLYLIKSFTQDNIRHSYIDNAYNVLRNFDSEYHLLFSEVKQFSENPKLDYISTHTIANISRQLLESFLSFKYGRKKLERCFDEISGFKDLPKVRKFVNHYSHKMDSGDSTTGFNDNIFGEADKVVPLVLQLINFIDPTHYTSMIKRINNT